MRVISALSLTLLVGVSVAPPARADGVATLARAYVASYTAHSASSAALIPPWARKYNMNCSGCHYPAAPRLNATGIRFRWAGYRMPNEIGDQVDVTQLENYVSIRGRMRFEGSKTQNNPGSDAFGFNDATLFYSGPAGKNLGGFFELEREPSGEVELTAHLQGQWGDQNAYYGFRTGQMHWLLRDGVAGFDRPTGVRTPIPVGDPITSAVPFRFSTDQLGIEWFYVRGRNRASFEILNGVTRTGGGSPGDSDPEKDFALIDQYLFDDVGSGLTLVGYYGSIKGLDTLFAYKRSHFMRVAVSANKIVSNFEALGGFVWGQDRDLPAGAADVSGLGFWLQGQRMFPKSMLTVFGRYEWRDPNTDVNDNATTRLVGGFVLPIGLPEYFRFALEGAYTIPQLSGANKTTALTAELMLNF